MPIKLLKSRLTYKWLIRWNEMEWAKIRKNASVPINHRKSQSQTCARSGESKPQSRLSSTSLNGRRSTRELCKGDQQLYVIPFRWEKMLNSEYKCLIRTEATCISGYSSSTVDQNLKITFNFYPKITSSLRKTCSCLEGSQVVDGVLKNDLGSFWTKLDRRLPPSTSLSSCIFIEFQLGDIFAWSIFMPQIH